VCVCASVAQFTSLKSKQTPALLLELLLFFGFLAVSSVLAALSAVLFQRQLFAIGTFQIAPSMIVEHFALATLKTD